MSSKRILVVAVAAVCGLFVTSASPAGAAVRSYRSVDLGIRGAAQDINDRGQVVGYGALSGHHNHPFLVDHGRTIDLGVLDTGEYEFGTATDINNRGQIAGTSSVTADREENGQVHAFRWENGRMTDLGTLGGTFSWATGINERGQVVGYSDTGTPAGIHGFLWQNGTMTDLGMRMAFDINNRGQIVGTSTFGTGDDHACLWQNGELTNLDTGTVPWPEAVAINDQGWIAGDNESTIPAHGFVWRAGVLTDLGTLGGDNTTILDVNERGQILGLGALPRPGAIHAFIWERGRMIDLGSHGMPDYPDLYAFNNRAQIVGLTYTDDAYTATVFR
jgi:probable HAF family extracellular repeat protein